MMFVSFNRNMAGVTSGAGTTHSSGAPEFTPRFFSGFRVAQSLVLYVVFCRSLFVVLSFLLAVVVLTMMSTSPPAQELDQ